MDPIVQQLQQHSASLQVERPTGRKSPPVQSPPGTVGHNSNVGPFGSNKIVTKTTTTQRVLRQQSHQHVQQAVIQPQQVQRTYSAPAVVMAQQHQRYAQSYAPSPLPPAGYAAQQSSRRYASSAQAFPRTSAVQVQHSQQIAAPPAATPLYRRTQQTITRHISGVQTVPAPPPVHIVQRQGAQQHYSQTAPVSTPRHVQQSAVQYSSAVQSLPPAPGIYQQQQQQLSVSTQHQAQVQLSGMMQKMQIGTSTQRRAQPPIARSAVHQQTISSVGASAGVQQVHVPISESAQQLSSSSMSNQGQSRVNTTTKVQQRRKSPPPQVQVSQAAETTATNSVQQRKIARARQARTQTTAIAGYQTTKWGGAGRQEAAKKGPDELAEYDDIMSDHLDEVSMDTCPMHWRWYPVKLGYFCGGGYHLIHYLEAEASLRGERPGGPWTEDVNTDPTRPGRAVTPPPGPGDGNWLYTERKFGNYPLPKNSEGMWFDGWSYKWERHPMWHLKE